MKKTLAAESNKINTQAENENWQQFKSDSDEKMTTSENKVEAFKQQSGLIDNKLKSSFKGKVAQLEHKNSTLRKKMKAYVDDRKDRQEKFTNDFSKDMKGLT